MNKMFVVLKSTTYDFNWDIKTCGVTNNEETAKKILNNEVEKEKDIQTKSGLVYDTEAETENSHEWYNEGYEASDGVNIFYIESDYIENFS